MIFGVDGRRRKQISNIVPSRIDFLMSLPLAVLINNRQSDRVRNHLIASTNFVACSYYFYLFFIVLSTFLRVEWVHFLSTLLAAA